VAREFDGATNRSGAKGGNLLRALAGRRFPLMVRRGQIPRAGSSRYRGRGSNRKLRAGPSIVDGKSRLVPTVCGSLTFIARRFVAAEARYSSLNRGKERNSNYGACQPRPLMMQ